jgi:hypothetical protein
MIYRVQQRKDLRHRRARGAVVVVGRGGFGRCVAVLGAAVVRVVLGAAVPRVVFGRGVVGRGVAVVPVVAGAAVVPEVLGAAVLEFVVAMAPACFPRGRCAAGAGMARKWWLGSRKRVGRPILGQLFHGEGSGMQLFVAHAVVSVAARRLVAGWSAAGARRKMARVFSQRREIERDWSIFCATLDSSSLVAKS